MNNSDFLFSVVLAGVFLSIVTILMLYNIQMRINASAASTIATRQTLQMDIIKSKADQGYNIDTDLMSTKSGDGQLTFYNGIELDANGNPIVDSDGNYTKSSTMLDAGGIVPDQTLGMPDNTRPLRYGQPYGFSNHQTWRWRTIFNWSNPYDLHIYEGRSGVNRGNFGEGYIYRGENVHVERDFRGNE